MRVKSRKPPAENFSTSERVTVLQFVGGADDGVGDQMRQMAGDGEHQVVVVGVHGLDIGAEQAPERGELFRRLRVGALRRRQDAPAVDEQLGKAGIGAGIFGARHRMRRHEMHGLRQMRAHVAHDRALDRADVGHGRARRQMRRDFLGHRAAGADRNAEDDEIGAFDRGGIALDHLIGQPQLGHAPARLRRARGGDDRARRALRVAPRARSRSRSARRRSAPGGYTASPVCSLSLPQEVLERLHHQAVRLFGADAHAQRGSAACSRRPAAGSGRVSSRRHWRHWRPSHRQSG